VDMSGECGIVGFVGHIMSWEGLWIFGEALWGTTERVSQRDSEKAR
jgi:hypothetical protein